MTNQGKDGPLRGAMPGMKLGAGRGLRVVCGRRQVRRLFGLTRLDQVVRLAASLAEIHQEAAEAGAEAV